MLYGLDTLALPLLAQKEPDGTVSLHLCVAAGRSETEKDTPGPREHNRAKVRHLYRKNQENTSAAESTAYSPESAMMGCSGTCCKKSTGQER
jgi:hypothetical protein